MTDTPHSDPVPPTQSPHAPSLVLESLRVTFRTRRGPAAALRGIDLVVPRGEAVAIVGESGSGKSTLAAAVLRLLPVDGDVTGRVLLDGTDLLTLDGESMRRVRGGRIGTVLQDLEHTFDPLMTIGSHIAEVLSSHGSYDDREARIRELLEIVSLDVVVARLYPHQLSGGMRQRAMLAIALAAGPALLLADEPTSAVDPSLRSRFADLLAAGPALGRSLLLLTHDLTLARRIASTVAVMYAGQIVEELTPGGLDEPRHPYTAVLARSERYEGPAVRGAAPDLFAIPPGCAFRPRCPERLPVCSDEEPPVVDLDGGRCRCHLHA